MRWSNDALKSTLHRVRAPQARSADDTHTPERFSIPYVSKPSNSIADLQFCGADKDRVIDAIPGTWYVLVASRTNLQVGGEPEEVCADLCGRLCGHAPECHL